jgi:LCP family protein required for cell wall assembly
LDDKRRKPIKLRPAGCATSAIWLVVIVLVLNIAGVFWLDSQLERTQAQSPNQIANTAGTNWLLVGSDSREGFTDEEANRLGTGGDIGSKRTDTIMVLHIPNAGKATLVSLPRDSYVQIPGYGQDKINAAFTYGGAPLLAQTVEQNTGLRIDHYAEIGMGGLANVVDAVGGIEICPAEGISDPLAGLEIQAGCQTMDGPTALGYVRTRATGLGDIDRVQRQREFFSALVNKVTTLGTYGNPFRGFPTIKAVAQSFTVGESDHVWNLLRVALAMRSGVETVTVPYSGFADTEVGSVVMWDQEQSQQLFTRLR